MRTVCLSFCRKVEGVLQRKYLDNIRPEYSRVYKIKDSVFVSASSSSSSSSAPPSSRSKSPQWDQMGEEERGRNHLSSSSHSKTSRDRGQEASLAVQASSSSDSSYRRIWSAAVTLMVTTSLVFMWR